MPDEQEEKLLSVLKKHKKATGWTLADIPGISPSTCMHRINLEDGAKPVRQPQRRLNPVILDVVKKEVTKKDHFPLPFIDQMLERLAGKSHYCFLDGFSSYMHIVPED